MSKTLKSPLPSINKILEATGGVELGQWNSTSSHLHWSLSNSDVLSQMVKVWNWNKAGGLYMFLIEAEQLQPTQPPQGLAQKYRSYSLSGIDGYYTSSYCQFRKMSLTSPRGLRQLTIRWGKGGLDYAASKQQSSDINQDLHTDSSITLLISSVQGMNYHFLGTHSLELQRRNEGSSKTIWRTGRGSSLRIKVNG